MNQVWKFEVSTDEQPIEIPEGAVVDSLKCTCSEICWPNGIDPEKQKHHENCDLISAWSKAYIAEFMRVTGWDKGLSATYCEATLENFCYDLDDLGDPAEMVSEDISCLSD